MVFPTSGRCVGVMLVYVNREGWALLMDSHWNVDVLWLPPTTDNRPPVDLKSGIARLKAPDSGFLSGVTPVHRYISSLVNENLDEVDSEHSLWLLVNSHEDIGVLARPMKGEHHKSQPHSGFHGHRKY
jgi:hypothetical protein